MHDNIREQLADALAHLPDYLGQHVLISTVALLAGIGGSLPLAVLATRSRWLGGGLLAAASIIQTIPSLALLALFYPLLFGVSLLAASLLGVSFSALGFFPAVLALTLYSVLPILRNTVTGIASVDPAITEAGRGLGMTDRQLLWQVELPLALPIILAGIRTATVWVVGIATLSTPVGQTSLGNYIFTGLQTENWVFVLVGCVAAAALAIVLDQLIGLFESAATNRSRRRALVAAVGLLAVIGGGLAPLAFRSRAEVTVGAKTFNEQFILAALIQNRLADAGLHADRREGLGSTVAFRALAGDDIDCYVDYTGTIWVNHMRRDDVPDRQTVLAEMTDWLRETHGIECLGPLGFENAYGLAMRREEAERLGVRTISDLARVSRDLTIGSDYEFFGRPEWQALRQRYGLAFARQRQYQSTFMYRAVADGDVDVISAFTSDGRIAAYDLVVLEDDLQAIPPYDAVLLLSPRAAAQQRVVEALRPLIDAISIDAMRRANQQVDIDGASPAQAARQLDQSLQDAVGDSIRVDRIDDEEAHADEP